MRAGRLRHRVHLQRRVDGFDGHGQPSASWVTHMTTWASVEPLAGRELLAAMEAGAKVSHRIRLRWRDGILPVDRVVHRGRALEVESVIDVDERRTELMLMAQERVA